MTARFIVADVFDGLATLEDGSIDLVITSPPFLALRSYLPADHPDKDKEIGSEPTPAEFIDTLLAVTAELRRVLAPHGSLCVELGDTYAGSGGAGGDYGENGLREGQARFDGSASRAYGTGSRPRPTRVGRDSAKTMSAWKGKKPGWPMAKSKALIPELYEIALAYGIHPLTGTVSPAGYWQVRNIVDWCRPNPPVGALGKKWRPGTSDVVVACMNDDVRYWDDLATRKPADPANKRPSVLERKGIDGRTDQVMNPLGEDGQRIIANSGGAPLLDWWEIPPTGYPGAHYAVYPPALVTPLVKAMCPQKVCRECGEPSRRIVSDAEYVRNDSDRVPARLTMLDGERPAPGVNQHLREDGANTSVTKRQDTLGWTDCGHDNWRPGRVLDPFAGSGTTLAVASGHGHDAIGIDLDPRNLELSRDRVGPFFFEEVTI